MEFGSWNVCEQTAVLQGALLLAEKLTVHKTLLEIKKSEWPLIEKPITDAFKEISSGTQPQCYEWRKRAIAIFWAKILSCQSHLSLNNESEIDRKWKEDVFFPVENMIPKINRVVLFELLKTTKAADIFAELLLALPADFWVGEASLMLHHIVDETSLEDVGFFLDVWWEIMKSSKNGQDETITMFSSVASQYLSNEELCQSSKRFKPDPEQTLPPADNILSVFLEGLHKIRPYIGNSELKCYTIANLTDMLCSSAFLERDSGDLPIKLYLEKLVAVLCFCNVRAKNDCSQRSLLEMVREANRIVQSGSTASRFRLLLGAQHFGVKLLKDLLHHWREELHNYMKNSEVVGYECYRMIGSLESLHKNLIAFKSTENLPEDQRGNTLELSDCVTNLLENAANVQMKCTTNDADMMAAVAMNIIGAKIGRYREVCSVFASEIAWAFSEDWFNCLKKNKELFREPDLVFTLLETVVQAASERNSLNSKQIRQSASVILDLFCELSLSQMNNILLRVLCTWGRKGLSHCMIAFTESFQEELNMMFNQISQNVPDSSAISRVARFALLYPEYVVNKACHFAISNIGAHVFLAKILTSLPALSFRCSDNSDTSVSLLCQCLMETCWGKLSSDKEESQFLYLLTYLMDSSETIDNQGVVPLLQPVEVVRLFVLPYILDECSNVEFCLQILYKALNVKNPFDISGRHWVLSCSPFPLIMSLCKLLNSYSRCWQQSDKPHCLTLESKALIIDILTQVCTVILPEAESGPETWNKSLFWLHRKMEHLDWVVCLRLKPIFGIHFKNEVPSSLFDVCKLSANEWTELDLPEYGPGTGLLAWLECCCISEEMRDHMLSILCVNTEDPDEVNLFSKGFLVAMVQVLPWCSSTECKLLTQVVRSLLQRQLLHVPYTLEYVQYMPLLNLRPFAYYLQFSVLLLRCFQLLCSSSCSNWLTLDGQKHIIRLYSGCISDTLDVVKQQLSTKDEEESDYVQEVLFLYSQVFCHVIHITAMMPENTCEPLFFLSLEILSLCETLRANDTSKNRLLRHANERHFLKSITESVSNEQHRATLMQKINKL